MKSWVKIEDYTYRFRNFEVVTEALNYFENDDVFLNLLMKFQIFELRKNFVVIPPNKISIFENYISDVKSEKLATVVPSLTASKIIELNLVESSEEDLDQSVHFFGGWEGFIKEIDNAFLSWLKSGQHDDGRNHYLVLPVRLNLSLNLSDMVRFLAVVSFCAYPHDDNKRVNFVQFVMNWYFQKDVDEDEMKYAVSSAPKVWCSQELAESFRKMTEPAY